MREKLCWNSSISLAIDLESGAARRMKSDAPDAPCISFCSLSLLCNIFIRKVSNLFIMSLAVADLVVGAIVMPISAFYVLTGQFRLFGACPIFFFVDYAH